MNIIRDRLDNTHHVILEQFQPTSYDVALFSDFVNNAFDVPEVIGGVYFFDMQGNQHYIELKDQGLHTMLIVLEALSKTVPIQINYEERNAPCYIWAEFWRLPHWLVWFVAHLFHPDMTFKKLFEYAAIKSRTNLSKSVSKSSE
jgi:hypothetical protein